MTLLENVMEPIFHYEECEIKSEISLVNYVNKEELDLNENKKVPIQPLNPRDDGCLVENQIDSVFYDIDSISHDININENENMNNEKYETKECEEVINNNILTKFPERYVTFNHETCYQNERVPDFIYNNNQNTHDKIDKAVLPWEINKVFRENYDERYEPNKKFKNAVNKVIKTQKIVNAFSNK